MLIHPESYVLAKEMVKNVSFIVTVSLTKAIKQIFDNPQKLYELNLK